MPMMLVVRLTVLARVLTRFIPSHCASERYFADTEDGHYARMEAREHKDVQVY